MPQSNNPLCLLGSRARALEAQAEEQGQRSSPKGTKRKDLEAVTQDSTAVPAKRAKSIQFCCSCDTLALNSVMLVGQSQTTSTLPMITSESGFQDASF